jgi:hypothetical protein
MGIGDDIKEAFEDVGSHYTIKRKSGNNLSGEYSVYEITEQNLRPFAREFLYAASLPYDTDVIEGDVLVFDDGRHFLMANKSTEQFENTAIVYECLLIKCNVLSGEILRASESWNANTYQKVPSWSLVEGNVSGAMIDAFYGNVLTEKEEFANLTLAKSEVYIPDTLDIKINDRFEPSSGEYYRADVIKYRIYPGINLIEVSNDTREG